MTVRAGESAHDPHDTGHEHRLPPGQTADELRRFGLPAFAARRPVLPAESRLVVSVGEHDRAEVPVGELLTNHRITRVDDLHCVTTWSAVDLRWSGVAFRVVHEWVRDSFGLPSSARWVRFRGLDGFRCCLRIDDAVAAEVLLADQLDGQPLTPDHGAPLRLVAPAHYGYKSVKHVASIDYLADYRPGPAGWMAHPRGRVAYEERSRFLPGRVWRPIWRAAVPMVRRRFEASR
ncbi:molybdopterin-dependent oxidoreductase [Nocardia asteroides]|uniref:molybdopterin-dependent oxidoreductase n=1 Tax=Nocardia asteroides TaxID=1824 RepID=UPI001E486EFB|nr:molybdopterin-dependent oxidoreductase [Nocardia asteroides]UGT55708.1 molybdopterin-dependent oxidoreductase [Nocardia asteroides]